ncbi:MAG: TonB-dependent receptor [Candidatus Aegiribacteria sp.]|nr:TonB-dependent receptor [Candidatus Aegiribacteria sp.]
MNCNTPVINHHPGCSILLTAVVSCLLLVSGTTSAAVTGTIAGFASSNNGDILVGVSVMIEGTPYGSMTDANGEYYIPRLSPGTYSVTARMVGMGSVTKEGVAVVSDQVTRIDFILEESSSGGTVIQVTEQRNLILENVPSTIHVIDREEIETMPVAGVLDIVQRQPGITAQGGEIHIRGGRSGEVAFLLDGVSMRSPVTNAFVSGIPLSALSEASITTGGLSARYGNAMSGVVNMVSKEGGSRYEGEFHVRHGDMSVFGYESESRNYSEPSENDNYRSDCINCELAFGGPEPITSYLLPAIGIDLPGEVRFFGACEWMRSGYDLEDSRGNWENNWQNLINGSGKLTWRPTGGTKMWVNGHYYYRQNGWDEWTWSLYDHSAYINEEPYLARNPDYAIPIRFEEDYGFTIGLTQMLSERSFMDFIVSWNRFCQWQRIRVEEGEYLGEGFSPSDWIFFTALEPRVADSTGFYHSGIHPDVWLESSNYVTTAKLDFTGKLNSVMELNTGLGASYYDLYDYSAYIENWLTTYASLWKAYPYSGSAYAELSSRFSGGLVLNTGLRFDYFEPNAEILSHDDFKLHTVSAKYHLSPRIGMTNPISDRDVFFCTYGHYFQMPNMNQMYFGTDYNASETATIVGNPDLDAQRTISYEAGLRHRFTNRASMAVSGFYKDITGLVRTSSHYSESFGNYFQYSNDESFGSVRGMEINFVRLPGDYISGSINYTYSIAQGKYSSATSQYEYSAQGDTIPPSEDNYLDWDQRHVASAHFNYALLRGSGPRVYGIYPLEGIELAVDCTYGSGFPYSPPSGASDIPRVNTERYPWTMQTDVKLSRRIWVTPLEFRASITIYNMFNRSNLDRIYDVAYYQSTGEPGGIMNNPGAYSPARHFLLSLDIYF